MEDFTFCESGLRSIVLSASLSALGRSSFLRCARLSSVEFEATSCLQKIENPAFAHTGFKSILIPRSVEVLYKFSFSGYPHSETLRFERGSKLENLNLFD
jgi:hypothetical protein